MPGKVSRDTQVSAYDAELAKEIRKYYADPLGYVMFNFPWSTDPSIQMVKLKEPWASRFPNVEYGPDAWACEYLDELGEEVKKRKFDGRVTVDPIRITTASGHGIGKSTLTSWLIMWIMDTRPFCRGTVTAGTDTQLRTKTWAELGKWHAIAKTRHWFGYNNSRGNMTFKRIGLPNVPEDSWKVTAITCKEENADSFAGQHAANSTSFYLFDEGSAVPDKIYDVALLGGMTDGEPMFFAFGNPTKNSGKFHAITVGAESHRFISKCIDSRTVEITNKKMIQEMIDDFGEESDRVKVRVRGLFPSASDQQFIAGEDVNVAMNRPDLPTFRNDALVLGVDVARFGKNDSVIYIRHGRDARTWEPRVFSGLDTNQLAHKIAQVVTEFEGRNLPVAAIFVDGTGVGGGCVDTLRSLGYTPFDVGFGSKPMDPREYAYRVDEMWGRMRTAIKEGLVLPQPWTKHGSRLRSELTQREYGIKTGGQIKLESKEEYAKRLGEDAGLDMADALALTFAHDVAPALPAGRRKVRVKTDFNPLDGV